MTSTMLMLGMPNGMEWMIILGVVLLLFGGSKLPQLAKALGQSKKAFKEGLDEAESAERLDKSNQASSVKSDPSLSAIDDEALFEEARRRARLRAAEAGKDDNLLSAKPVVEQKR
jgi:sec-independent protein translocase protein TatA